MANGTRIDGLTRRKSGRWKVSSTGQTFNEPDELLAVARFQMIEAERNGQTMIRLPVAVTDFANAGKIGATAIRKRDQVTINYPRDHTKPVVVERELDCAEVWAFLRQELLLRPKYVSQMTGIEQLSYLTDLREPEPSPTLADVGELYADKAGLSDNEAGRSRLFWKEFTKAVGVATVRELKHEHVALYEKKIVGSNLAPKSILHRYRKIRTILAHSIKRGSGIEDCRRALDVTAMLEVKEAHPLDPKPIKPADFWAIYDAAEKAEDRTFTAMMLTALNMAAYAGEAAALKWDEVDLKTGEVVTRRPKTGVSRVCMLWPETLRAIKALPRHGDYIFNTRVRSYTVYSALDSWRKYRESAELGDEIVFGMIRDAAFTIACKVSLDQARVLAGHKMPGMTDAYLRRTPDFVTDACLAIRSTFLSKAAVAKRKGSKAA